MLCGTHDLRKTWIKLRKFRHELLNWSPVYATCHIKNDCNLQLFDLPSLVYRMNMIEVYKFIHGIYVWIMRFVAKGTSISTERTQVQIEEKALPHTFKI